MSWPSVRRRRWWLWWEKKHWSSTHRARALCTTPRFYTIYMESMHAEKIIRQWGSIIQTLQADGTQ